MTNKSRNTGKTFYYLKTTYFPIDIVECNRYAGEVAEAWIPAPEKRKNWVPCKPSKSLFENGPVECRFHSNEGDWFYGKLVAIGLDRRFMCELGGTTALNWYSVCEVIECP